MCTPPPLSAGRIEPPTKSSKRGGLTGPEGGCNCHIKNKLKSEIFNDIKNL